MFDSVLGQGSSPRARFGAGTVASVVVHVGLFAIAVFLSTRSPADDQFDAELTFFTARPPPPPPPGPPRTRTASDIAKPRPVRRPDTVVTARDPTPMEPLEQVDSASGPEEMDGVEGGVDTGEIGGIVGSAFQGGRETGTTVVPFGAGMFRPEQLSGSPQYTDEALEARVEGTMVVRCVITTEGRAEKCRILQPLPHLDEAVLAALRNSRWKPARYQDRPISVEYTIPFRFRLP